MTADDFRAELESELAWRQEELAFFKNQLNNLNSDQEKNRYRKSMVLILYSHFEGYTKIALLSYIKFINQLEISRKDVVSSLMVAGMNREFLAYDDTDRKCEIFRRTLPDDHSLHRHFRRVDLINQIDAFKESLLVISDSVINTESNLRYAVLQKNLYKLGLPENLFDEHRNDIDALVNRRNSIAHGSDHSGVTDTEFANWERKITLILSEIMRQLYDHALHQRYLKTNSAQEVITV